MLRRVHRLRPLVPFEFSLNVFTEFAQTCHSATSCVRDQDPTTVPVGQDL